MILKEILKGTFRFIHVLSGCFFIGNALSDVVWGLRPQTEYLMAYITFGLGLLISGVVNVLILKPSIDKDNKIWVYCMYSKSVVWLLFIPIPDLITDATGHTFPRKEFNLALVLIILLLSVISKTIRDTKI